VSVRTGGQ